MTNPGLSPEHIDMSRGKVFELLSSVVKGDAAPRLGRLSLAGRQPIETPNYTSVTSRGAIPHITPDNFRKHIHASSAYMALEDFIEKKPPPIYSTPTTATTATTTNSNALHAFNAFPQTHPIILGPRRCPAVSSPVGNKQNSIAVYTSTGFFDLTVAQYNEAAQKLCPDIVIPLADIQYTESTTPAQKKLVRMVDRTEQWLQNFVETVGLQQNKESTSPSSAIFAPILPVPHAFQWEYFEGLAEPGSHSSLSGLALYDVDLLPDVNTHDPLVSLPKLSLDPPSTPQETLRQVSLGVDICTLPFLNSVSDSGIALDFTFPPQPSPVAGSSSPQPLGHNMWSESHQTAIAPLAEGCQCYACKSHHRAYLHHLLNAKEMLGWNLLQIHNHHVAGEFFAGIRETLKSGGAEAFQQAADAFALQYESELPKGTGTRPRARGYHFKSEMGQDKMNKPAWKNLNGEEKGTGDVKLAT